MPVFFVSSQAIRDNTLTIHGSLHTHLTKSLRYRVGDSILCGDENRRRYQVRITSLEKHSLEGSILGRQTGPPPPSVFIVLGLSLLKGEHMNWAVQKATELGVHAIVPLIAQRSIVRPDAGRAHQYQDRWQRIALDAAQQSERWDVPRIDPPCDVPAFLAAREHDGLTYFLVERGESKGIAPFSLDRNVKGLLTVASGPEGGWSEEEKNLAKRHHFTDVSLGDGIFRAETAPLVALTLIQNHLGRFG